MTVYTYVHVGSNERASFPYKAHHETKQRKINITLNFIFTELYNTIYYFTYFTSHLL
jgi:hypothetical protein